MKQNNNKQKSKLHIYLKQVGLWNEAMGFIFLAVAAFVAILYAGTSSSVPFSGFFASGFVSFAVSVEITLWLITGVLYLLMGWYLRRQRRSHTTTVLVATIILSLLCVLNLLPVIPLILSIIVLVKANRMGLSLDSSGRPKRSFTLKRQPDLIVALVLIAISIVAIVIANVSGAHIASKSSSNLKIPKPQYATCETTSPVNSCVVTSAADGFSITFPSKPQIFTMNNTGANPSDEDMPTHGIRHTDYSYDTSTGLGSSLSSSSYYLGITDFGQPITAETADLQQSYQKDRLQNGSNAAFQACDSLSNQSLNSIDPSDELFTTYMGLPAMQVNMTGTSWNNTKCTYLSLAVLKNNKLYTLSYVAIPNNSDSAPFSQFLHSFSLTN